MSRTWEEVSEHEVFNVNLVKCSEPILIKDEKNNVLCEYPIGYNEIFDHVYPPEEWEENGKTWRRVASTLSANRQSVIDLGKELNSQMKYWRAKEQGLCPIRRELYNQFFNEVLRQVCIINIDRGLLLIRIREEFKTNIEAYKQLLEDNIMYGTRKTVVAVKVLNELENNIKSLKENNEVLKKQLSYQTLRKSNLNEYYTNRSITLKNTNEKELNFFKKNHEALKGQLNILLTKK